MQMVRNAKDQRSNWIKLNEYHFSSILNGYCGGKFEDPGSTFLFRM